MTSPCDNQQKREPAVLANHRVKLKESKKTDLARQLKKL